MSLRSMPALAAAFLISGAMLTAQSPEKKLGCEDRRGSDTRRRVCEMKEMTMAHSGRVGVDASPNGGITIAGWSRNEVLVRARVEAWGDDDAEARATLGQVRVNTAGGEVKADGPKSWNQQRWSVSYEIFVPVRTDLKLETTNGGIAIADVRGAIEAAATNGGLKLARLGGRVRAETTNGGVNIELGGRTWEGESLEVETTNGGVSLDLPDAYSARIEAKTTNGGLHSDLPNSQVSGKSWGPRSLSVTSGSGGPLIRLETTNGGVKIRRKNAA